MYLSLGVSDLINRAHKLNDFQKAGHHVGASVAVFAAMAAEAFLSDFSLLIKQGISRETNPRILAAHSLLPKLDGKTSLLLKYELLYYVLAQQPLPKGGILWNNFDLLIKIRNNIAHFKSSEVEPAVLKEPNKLTNKEHKEIIMELKNKKLTHIEMRYMPPDWTRVLDESNAFADWSIKSAQDIILFMCDAIPECGMKAWFNHMGNKGSSLMGGNRR